MVRILTLILALGCATAWTQEIGARARQMEESGQAGAARAMVLEASQAVGASVAALSAAAEFLDRHGDPETRKVYSKLLDAQERAGSVDRAKTARRLVVLDLLAGDRAAAGANLERYRKAAPAANVSLPPVAAPAMGEYETIEIPGPMRSFSRMAALSPDLPGEEILAALARNVVTNGYQAANSNEGLEQTEFLKLVVRYLSQARELTKLSGAAKKIQIDQCESPVTADLLRILGYRMRGGCGAEVVLETLNASRAFLTIDSGFPLAELEQALRTNRPFTYDYAATKIPVLYTAEYWLGAKEKQQGEFIDQYLSDPQLCRLYLGVSKLDREVAAKLKAAVPVMRLKAFSHVLDFFGGMFAVSGGKAVVPGGPKAEAAWAELAGSPPSDPAAFFEKLVAKDDGWLASYFDALQRISGPVQDYLIQTDRLKRFYGAVRGRVTSPGPARPVFRANTDLLLLTTRLRMGTDGRPHVPGNVEMWKQLFIKHPHGKYDGKLTKAAAGWKDPDDILEALFALCRKAVENEPLKIYMALSDMDRKRTTPLAAATADRLAREFRSMGAQYALLNETGALSDATILAFLDTAAGVMGIRDQGVRSNAAGAMQGLAGMWQIFVRQGSIAASKADESLSALVTPFAKIRNERDVFDAGMGGVHTLLHAAGAGEGANIEEKIVDLLAGAGNPADAESHTLLVQDMVRVMEAQRLVSVKAIADLAAHLDAVGKGSKLDPALIARVSSRLTDIQLPRAGLSGVEKNSLIFGYWSERHIEFQRKLNLRSMVERAGTDPERLHDVRGALAPLLRDTLVGLLYAHYAPPGAQVLYTNPVFVRSHDFLGLQGATQTWRQTEVMGSGWPASSGGRLVGSLVGLSYALAEAEQNFLVPSREQALIWGDLVPQIVQSSKIPRFWRVTPSQMHWVGLHVRWAETALAEGLIDAALREKLVEELARYAPPGRARLVGQWLGEGRLEKAMENVTPSEMFLMARTLSPERAAAGDSMAAEIARMAQAMPNQASYEAISRAFGTPKPTLTNSYQPELLYLRTFPTLMGYSSRIMAESWESTLLYFAAVADASYMRPSQLNVVVPQWTRNTVEKIFATHLEDWPALLRSMRTVGAEIRDQSRKTTAGGGE